MKKARPPHSIGRGFTLTEVMIALALVSLLLIGISRIFTMTSSTIGIGQGLSATIRGQRAIGQALSTDILGAGKQIGRPDKYSGMIPIDTVEGSAARQPCIIISNFRQAAFLNEQEERNDTDYNNLSNANKLLVEQRSRAIRTIDADNITIPRYAYGVRNQRLDTFSFFTSGQFTRQTGSQVAPYNQSQVNTAAGENSSLFIAPLTSTEAWVWYGHLRVFNGNIAKLDTSVAYGSPGAAQTPNAANSDGVNNKNNLYASQFRLGRMQVLLKEPEDQDGDEATLPTVVGDDGLAQNFIFRMNGLNTSPTNLYPSGWIQPTDNIYFTKDSESNSNPNTRTRTGRTPLSYGSECQIFVPPPYNPTGSVNDNHLPVLSNTLDSSSARIGISIEGCRSDVAGVSATRYRERLSALFNAADAAFLSNATNSASNYIETWQQPIFASFNERPWCNPFPAIPFDSKKMSQRSQLLSDNVTSFIVEFAGDFGAQNDNGVFNSIVPDGIVDFVAIPRGGGEYDRQTRWYGMPRDVNGDGVILGRGASTTAIAQSPDVVPVRDVLDEFLGTLRPPGMSYNYQGLPFEKVVTVVPGTGSDYLKDRGNTQADETGSYVCAWGPQDFDGTYDDTANESYYSEIYTAAGNPPRGTLKYRPSMIRVIVDMVDPQGKLSEPMTQEYVYPVRINN